MQYSVAPYAADPAHSQGRRYPEAAPQYRSEFQRDRDRIIHSKAFRRLEYKTQVFVNHEGDLYRTRLTHSLEVAQIARSVARSMGLNEDLTEAIALSHDLGHTPFGHAGQDELNDCMKAFGGFEHNLQSLRVVDVLEDSYADFPGINLTFETREGILKHCAVKHAAALGDVGERFLNKTQPSLEAQLTNLADEIAYNNHDIEDGLRSGLITLAQLQEVPVFAAEYEAVLKAYPDLQGRRLIRETLRRMIGRMVVDLTESSQAAILASGVQTLAEVRAQSAALIRYSETMRSQKNVLKKFLRENLYFHPTVYRMTWRARQVVRALFAAYMQDVRLLTPKYQAFAKRYEAETGEAGRARAIADFIAGMTDRYAMREYGQLFDLAGLR
ncbi:MAG TPA: deoxyguanosinetriphosphate triphosphohydrolase [Candidatus Thiothrix moscowensis]|uniref:deoxyguanosinetriphosphate triphosphohydrolase n=1 Tax=unclassified Thiothrix TaxID=2636184 RepID=UPI001A35D225|nr:MULTISPECIES: deoxyguanosinetriphosphate triphosphohydrolase [unclassified Thiothrix]MBJ6611303.1 deoxyguanosinetriphosphate triphosphohydrolase [Candidatus Thiothrix moscowensis]HRJ53263.1 deoxyguanosinetriphosphate triphosphohydrolase [Candidatus Thiothrix moscowensis]HRJ93167.1 deoxyguanosinetriphosphate triphosphohydrolase [Candidatus Thiothrix moscowensis]